MFLGIESLPLGKGIGRVVVVRVSVHKREEHGFHENLRRLQAMGYSVRRGHSRQWATELGMREGGGEDLQLAYLLPGRSHLRILNM